MQTLKRERRQKFEEILGVFSDKLTRAEIEATAELLAAACESRTEETAEEYNVELFRGDHNDYPEHLRDVAKNLRDVWKFALPGRSKNRKEKGQYAFFIMAMEDIKRNCAEFGTKVLDSVHDDFVAYQLSHNGLAPFTIGQPSSLINVCNGKARELRDKVEQPERPEYQKFVPKEGEYVPNPNKQRPNIPAR
jgi:hypothetical protein